MADEQTKSKLLEQFFNVTGVRGERAKFFLEMAAWNCDTAIANFYEDGGAEILSSDDDVELQDPAEHGGASNIPRQPSPPLQQFFPPQYQQPHTFEKKSSKKPKESSSKIKTLNTLKHDEDSSSEEDGQAFYAGGSESGGGQQILGPKKKKDPNNLVSDVFKMAREHGAEVVENTQASSSGNKKQTYFQGQAYRLGAGNDEEEGDDNDGGVGGPSRGGGGGTRGLGGSSVNSGASTSNSAAAHSSAAGKRQVDVVLKFWRDGFSVDNGPLRSMQDPANMEFLEDIKNGRIPKEFATIMRDQQINLSMEDHSSEEYVKPKVTLQAFSGHGYRLGNPTDGTPVTPKQSTKSATASNNNQAGENMSIDNSRPITTLQIRLPDGSRLTAKFNHTHTIADVRNYLITSQPSLLTRDFTLMTTFPKTELDDLSATLSSANLINAVLVIKYK